MQHEIFNQHRKVRCVTIQQAIMDNLRKTNIYEYTIRATDSVYGIALDEFRTRYFAVGVGEDLTEIPFTDMLFIFSMIEQERAAMKSNPSAKQFTYEVTTEFSDDEAIRLLSQVEIEIPFDPGKGRPFSAVRLLEDPPGEDDRA